MKFAAFGDSFIFGSDLKDCHPNELYSSEFTWPALLAKKFNLEYFCLAVPAAGNQQICNDVSDMIAKHGNSMFYSVHWTWIDRFDYIAPQQDRFYPHPNWTTVCPSTTNSTHQLYYKHFHCELLDKIKSLGYIYQTIMLLKEAECRFHMTYMDSLILDTDWNITPSVEMLQKKCKPYLFNYDGNNFLEWSKKQGFAISNNWHPLEQSHQKASEYWMPVYQSLLNTHAKEDYLHAFI